jgi:hypothetical protein
MKKALLAGIAAIALAGPAFAQQQTLGQAAGELLGFGGGAGGALSGAGGAASGVAGAVGGAASGNIGGVLGGLGGALPGLDKLGGALGGGQIVHDPIHQGQVLVQWGMQLNAMKRQFEAVAHSTSVSGAAFAAGGLMNQRLPGPGDSRAYMQGRSGHVGAGAEIMEQDRLYAPSQDDEWAQDMRRSETVTANAKAIAEDAAWEAQLQLDSLDQLKAQIEEQPDGTANAALGNALVLQRQKLEATKLKLDHVKILLAADDRVTEQRASQRWRRDLDKHMEKTAFALEGW